MNYLKGITFLGILFGIILFGCSPKQSDVLQAPPQPESFPIVVEGDSTEDESFVEEPVVEVEPPTKPKAAPVLLLSFEQTSCLGYCPAFEVRLFSDGRAVYLGREDVERLGMYETWLKPTQIDGIMAKANEIQYFQLADQYPVSDILLRELPMVITYLRIGDQQKSITNNYNAPLKLRSFEDYLSSFFDALPWEMIKTSQ